MIDRLIMKNTNIQAISLFSGAGGLDIGAKQNNIKLKVSIDNDEDSVSHVKWFWSNNMSVESIKGVSKYLGDDYVSIPKISVNMTEKIWDKSYCYLHCKPKNIKIQKLDEKDILGWFLC